MAAYLLTILVPWCVVLAAPRPFTLPEAQKALFSYNTDILIAEMRQSQSNVAVAEAYAAWHPGITSFLTYGCRSVRPSIHMGREINFPLGQDSALLVPLVLDQPVGDFDSYEMGVDLVIPAFAGLSRMYAVRASKNEADIRDAAFASLKQRLSMKLGSMFFSWEHACKRVLTKRVLVDQISEYAARMRSLHDGGLEPRSKVLGANACLEGSRVELIVAQMAADSLRLELLSFVGRPDEPAVPVAYPAEHVTGGIAPVKLCVNRERPELTRYDLQCAALENARLSLLGRRFPALFLSTGYRLANPGLAMGSNDPMGYSIAGLHLEWNMYDGMENRAKRAQLAYEMQIAELEKKKLADRFARMVALSSMQIEKAQRVQRASGLSLEAAREAAGEIETSVSEGETIHLAYLDALARVAKAELDMHGAQMMYKIALLQLKYAAGEEIEF